MPRKPAKNPDAKAKPKAKASQPKTSSSNAKAKPKASQPKTSSSNAKAKPKPKTPKTKIAPRYVLYYFYMDRCPYCIEFDEVWDSLGDSLPSLVQTKKVDIRADRPKRALRRDAAAREAMGDTVPSIVLVDARAREPRVIRFANDRTKERLLAWVTLHTGEKKSELKTIREIRGDDASPEKKPKPKPKPRKSKKKAN